MTTNYDVTFDTAGKSSADSMPLGNGDVALNVWTGADGTIHAYVSKSDAWDEHGRLIKVGRVAVQLSPNPFAAGLQQTLRLETASIEVRNGAGSDTVKVWVDANAPRVHIQGCFTAPVTARLVVSEWRAQPRPLADWELHAVDRWTQPMVASPDRFAVLDARRIGWWHRNEASLWRAVLEHQGLGDFADRNTDPLLGREFGAVAWGEPFRAADARTLASEGAVREFDLTLEVFCAVNAPGEAGVPAAVRAISPSALDRTAAWVGHSAWWREFWQRSFIHVRSRYLEWEGACVSQTYAWQRFLFACAGRGQAAIKFNGSLFTADWNYDRPGSGFDEGGLDADYRRWGGAYWFQNTRLIYWPMLAAGDFDLMRPLFRMYRDALPLAEERNRRWFGHEGAFFPETMYFFGALLNRHYGLDRAGRPPGWVQNPYIGRQRCAMLELVALGLDYFEYSGDAAGFREWVLPVARNAARFYRNHYPRDAAGRLRLAPVQSIEQFHDVVNPTPDLAGLHFILPRLLALKDDLAGPDDRALWRELLALLPPLPMAGSGVDRRLVAAEEILDPVPRNTENPELYVVFPYRLYGLGRELEIGRNTFMRRATPDTGGWRQDAIQAALLGLPEAAKFYLLRNCLSRCEVARFPGFTGPNFDWIPDQCHGGVSMTALQRMLVQPVGRELHIGPAWPPDWDVTFQLALPGGRVVSGELADGRIRSLQPPANAADLIVRTHL